MFDVTIAVPTYGGSEWRDLAQHRAIPSATGQAPALHVHSKTLMDARNEILERVQSEWIIYLDADDELAPGYVEAMSKGIADIRAPYVQYIRSGNKTHPKILRVAGHSHICTTECLEFGNWIVIGAAVRTQMLRDIGGWRDFTWSEDWDTWLRCWKDQQATAESVAGAIYMAHVRLDSRNRSPKKFEKLQAHKAIYEANFNKEFVI